MMRSLCTLVFVAVTVVAAPPALAQDGGDADAGDAGVDAGDAEPAIDGGQPPDEDAGQPPEEDAGQPPDEDAGQPPDEDAGQPPDEDAGQPPDEDAGQPPDEDAGQPPDEDAGQTPVDGGQTPVDAGETPVDAGQPPEEDAGQTPVDAGQTPGEDAGLEPVDAGGLPPFDAGHPGGECVPRCIDAQREGRCSTTGQLVPIVCGADETCEVDQCVPAALAGATGCACRQGGSDTTIAFLALLLGVRLVRRRARGRREGAPP